MKLIAAAVAAIVPIGWWAIAAPLCDLSPVSTVGAIAENGSLDFPIKYRPRLDMEFAERDGGVHIKEIVSIELLNLVDIAARIGDENVKRAGADRCGFSAELSSSAVAVAAEDLEVLYSIAVNQWGCFGGVRAKVAAGVVNVEVLVKGNSKDEIVSLTSEVTITKQIKATAAELREYVDDKVAGEFSGQESLLRSSIEKELGRVGDRLSDLQAQPHDNDNSLYRPKTRSVGFQEKGSLIEFVRQREVDLRAGTACAVRERAMDMQGG